GNSPSPPPQPALPFNARARQGPRVPSPQVASLASVSLSSPGPCLSFSVGQPSPTPATAHSRDSAVTLLFRAASPPPRQAGRAVSPCARPPPPPRGHAPGGGGAERAWGAGRRAARHGRRGARALAVSPGRAHGHAHSRARARTAGRRQRLAEAVASLSRSQGRPQQQPRAAASGAGAGTAAGSGGGAEGSKMSTEAQRVDDSPSTSGGSSDGDQRESVQQEPEREQVQPKKKEGKISSKTAAKLSTSAKRIQKELAEITLDPPPNCRCSNISSSLCYTVSEALLTLNRELKRMKENKKVIKMRVSVFCLHINQIYSSICSKKDCEEYFMKQDPARKQLRETVGNEDRNGDNV
uniref:Ubiquitin conjugating enzyme E2 E2 n=4 Tax=Boreoeutheria TaxID=1437010 RepID=A0ABI7XB90_FELCA